MWWMFWIDCKGTAIAEVRKSGDSATVLIRVLDIYLRKGFVKRQKRLEDVE
jgi:hypothetical protein